MIFHFTRVTGTCKKCKFKGLDVNKILEVGNCYYGIKSKIKLGSDEDIERGK